MLKIGIFMIVDCCYPIGNLEANRDICFVLCIIFLPIQFHKKKCFFLLMVASYH